MSRLTRKTNGKDYCLYCDCIEKENEIFEKNQKLLSPEEYYKEEPYTMEDSYYLEDAMNRLGKLEDLEEELGIDAFELLQDFKKQKENLGDITKEVEVDYLAHIVLNGISYRKISEELGCPLEVVFKALTKGIEYEIEITTYYAVGDIIPTKRLEKRKNIQEIKLKKYIDKFTFFVPYDYSRGGIVKNDIIYLKDYQKTWWLKGEKYANI